VQTKPWLEQSHRSSSRQEDEEEVQTKPLLQRQEDEEEIQTKPSSSARRTRKSPDQVARPATRGRWS